MKKCLLTLACLCIGMGYLSAQNKSNKGKEFWVGYGHHQYFATDNSQEMVLYLSAEQAANVTVSINGTTFSQTYSIPANTVNAPITIPKTGGTDARLYNTGTSEGTFNRGIHIVSDTAITAFAHIYATTSSGATMLMPVDTWGYNYFAICAPQFYAANCFSWFYIVASEDETKVEIIPPNPTRGGLNANQLRTVVLNKGQIYQVLGANSGGNNGYDMTGAKIKSVQGTDGICHPIGVFSGSSRTMFCENGVASNGGDNIIQQVFPASAWGTKYLTAPIATSTSASVFNNSRYRVAVRDPATIVKRNGIAIPASSLINNFYYDFSSNRAEFIEADKPILVAQYMLSQGGGCASINGTSDPEMFYLSPVEQSIKKTVFYASSQSSITKGYVSVIVPTNGVPSLKIDGVSGLDHSFVHPCNCGYTIGIKSISLNQQHIIESDSSFTAITYGTGANESYGYNAGTLINNLNNIGGVQNSYGGTFAAVTCPNTPFRFSMQAAYKPSQMIWKLSQIPSLLPVNVDTTINNPIPADSSTINGRKYYTYSLPREYSIPVTGTYNLPVTCTAPEIDNCNNTETITTTITVNLGPKGNFTWSYSGCVSDTAYLSGVQLTNAYTIAKYRWYYDDNTEDSVQNPKKKFNTQGGHPTKLRLVSTTGCIGDTIKTILTAPSPLATFGMTPPQACGSASVTFTDTSSFVGGAPLTDWYWDFGNGNTVHANSNTSQTQSYPSPGAYTIKHVAGVVGGCGSDTATKILHIYANPVADFTYNTGCLQDSTLQLTNATTVADGQALTWAWDFGEPSSAPNNTSTLLNPTHRYHSYNTFPITLVATTVNGCTATITKNYTVTGFSSAIVYDVDNEANLCSNTQVKLTNQINITQDSVYRIELYWDFANAPTVFDTDNTPTQNEVYNHSYPVFITPATKTYTIKWVVYSKGGCVSEKTKTITLNAKPDVQFATLIGKCINAGVVSIANGNITNGLSGNPTYSGTGVDAAGNFNPATAGVGQFPIQYLFTSAAGCKDSVTQNIRVFPKSTAKFGYLNDVCLGDSIRFKDSSTISAGNIATWNWNFGDGNNTIKTSTNAFYYTYGSANTFTVTLTTTSDSACVSDPYSLPVLVRQRPVSTFTISLRLCKDTVVTFTPTSSFGTGTIQTWYWNFGNTQTATTANSNPVTTTYLAPGSYTVKHAVNAGGGCISDTATQTFTVYANPVVNFTVSSGCLPDSTATFTDGATVSDGQSFTWLWNFGDANATPSNPNTTTVQSPTHRFTQYGTYPVRLTATTSNGCAASLTQGFRVRGYLPTVLFDVANESLLCSNKQVKLTNQTPTTIDSIYRIDIYWDFANQPTVFQTDLAPAQGKDYLHAYPTFTTPATQTYTIKWVVYSKGICSVEKTKTITLNAMPTLTFATLIGKCVNADPISIANANITNSLAGTGAYAGNGTDASGLFTPATAGIGVHPIRYIYITTGGCIDSVTSNIRVFPKPIAGFTYNNNVCLKDSILLTDTSKISSGTILTRNWDFADATTAVKTNALPFYHTYTAFGNYQIKLYAVSDSSCVSDTAKQNVVVYPLPQVAYTLPLGVCMPTGQAIFTNQSTIPNGNGSQLSYVWDFGDGGTSSAFAPTHYYTAAGSYNVFLTAVSAQGCMDTLTKNLSAFYQKPVADFAIIGDTLCPNYFLTFNDLSVAPSSTIASWDWIFGDGGVSTSTSPQHAYGALGNYVVQLTVKNPEGCISEPVTKPIKIFKQPVVDAGPNIWIRANTSITLKATTNDTAMFHYLWTPSTYLDDDTLLRPTSTPAFNTTYKLMAFGGGGNCVAYDTVKVTALQFLSIANAFSPNGDKINDEWEIPYLADYPESKVEIFNRNGQLVFRSVGYQKTWDGKMNGVVLPVGTYYYIIEPKLNGYSKLSGSVTILK